MRHGMAQNKIPDYRKCGEPLGEPVRPKRKKQRECNPVIASGAKKTE
jgi:hypothetical protein